MRSGIELLADVPGTGPLVDRQRTYLMRLRMWLNKGEAVRWNAPWGNSDRARLEDDGATLISDIRVHRENLISGLFYGIDGMRIGGTRRLKISPHMGYGPRGVPGSIAENAVLVVEVSILEEREDLNSFLNAVTRLD